MSWSYVWLSLDGRINRQVYWLRFALPYVLISLAAVLIHILLVLSGAPGLPLLPILVVFAGIWPSITAAVKRLHDRGRSGWFLLLALIPFVNIWVMIEVYFLKGTDGPNRFGPDPLAAPAGA